MKSMLKFVLLYYILNFILTFVEIWLKYNFYHYNSSLAI